MEPSDAVATPAKAQGPLGLMLQPARLARLQQARAGATVQATVVGNTGGTSGAGVGFTGTRPPACPSPGSTSCSLRRLERRCSG